MDAGALPGSRTEIAPTPVTGSTEDVSPPPRKTVLPFRRKSPFHPSNLFRPDGPLRPFRLLKADVRGRAKIWHTDWFFNQLILASAVYLFFTNLLPGITFASDLYAQTGKNYGTIEVVFSTGLCGVIFAL